ncbi:MAG: DNA-3-methyladenine glycosylase family protein [Arenimonas sp.]
MAKHPRGFDIDAAVAHLSKRDKKLGRWIAKIGVLEIDGWDRSFDTVDSLARSILYQQLSGKAAATIVGRVEKAIGSKKINAKSLTKVQDEHLRACGVSGNKTRALRDLAARDALGEIPRAAKFSSLSNDEIIEKLVAVRGIGRWTVEMMLMFRLGRPDVLPVDDLGVRKGAQILDKLEGMPTPKELILRGEKWAPYRTLAAMYCWRIVDAETEAKPKVKRSQD